jgi:hypothetical protein
MSDKKPKRKTSLLIYSPPKNSTLNIRSYFFIKEIFFLILSLCLHYTEMVLREDQN